MKKVSALVCCLFGLSLSNQAQDITSLKKIGPVVSFAKGDAGVTLNCGDNSQIRIVILASDLIRVRATFTNSIPARDHSWAIAKEKWETPRWSLSETAAAITLATDEVEVIVQRSPLLIDFRDARTHITLNAASNQWPTTQRA